MMALVLALVFFGFLGLSLLSLFPCLPYFGLFPDVSPRWDGMTLADTLLFFSFPLSFCFP